MADNSGMACRIGGTLMQLRIESGRRDGENEHGFGDEGAKAPFRTVDIGATKQGWKPCVKTMQDDTHPLAMTTKEGALAAKNAPPMKDITGTAQNSALSTQHLVDQSLCGSHPCPSSLSNGGGETMCYDGETMRPGTEMRHAMREQRQGASVLSV
ncbi:hypothetical protein FB451DRAFT_1186696 [Mycena latifolia]|nr:hypothetical protein FB451DRAFT_1186696 [Mycena latifolia]